MELFFHEQTWLFSAAIGLVLALGVMESIGLLLGHGGLSGWFEHGLDLHGADLADGGVLAWLHLGKVPLTILLILFLSAFGLAGFLAQILARALLGQFLPLPIVAAGAVMLALPAVRGLGGLLARILPKDQSSAVSPDELVGRIAIVTTGTARSGFAAEARVKDGYGTTHYVMVEPDTAGDEFPSGTEVLLLRRVGGRRFQVTANPRPGLLGGDP